MPGFIDGFLCGMILSVEKWNIAAFYTRVVFSEIPIVVVHDIC